MNTSPTVPLKVKVPLKEGGYGEAYLNGNDSAVIRAMDKVIAGYEELSNLLPTESAERCIEESQSVSEWRDKYITEVTADDEGSAA